MSDKAASQLVDAEMAAVPDDEPELDLFAEPATLEGASKRGTITRGPGRPPGAKNRRNERTLERLKALYIDPRERLAAVISMGVADLAALLHCSMLEAAQEQRLAAAILLPFWAQKQPLAVNFNGTFRAVHLHVDLSGVGLAGDGAVNVSPRVLDSKEFQELSEKEGDDV